MTKLALSHNVGLLLCGYQSCTRNTAHQTFLIVSFFSQQLPSLHTAHPSVLLLKQDFHREAPASQPHRPLVIQDSGAGELCFGNVERQSQERDDELTIQPSCGVA